jgi:Lanthionine synthetase C-like protein
MFEKSRHLPLRSPVWDPGEASNAIQEIVGDALDHFDQEHFWPAHPLEDGLPDGNTSLYCGATGVIWALQYLARIGATPTNHDFRSAMPRLIEANRTEFAQKEYSNHGSLLFGDMGTALLAMRVDPVPAIADAIYARASANTALPVRELMWGMPGSMLACIFMSEMTSEFRWRELYQVQAVRLLDQLEETDDGPLWTQDLYGNHRRWLGPVHGYAGNMIPLIRRWTWLTDQQRARVADAIPRTLSDNAWRSQLGTTWHAMTGRDAHPKLCQHCHGAPGMVTTFADAPFTALVLEELLLEGGHFTWQAGPLAKGSNLCHGTGGNGYAFLKLYRRTKNPDWLQRARDFAMAAIAQCRDARAQYGKGRYSLWTGDVGLAIYLHDCLNCLTTEPRFPTVDVF